MADLERLVFLNLIVKQLDPDGASHHRNSRVQLMKAAVGVRLSG